MEQIKLYFIYSDPEKNERFIEHLINTSSFCISCGDLCDDCRLTYKSHSKDINGIHMLPDNLPAFIEEPEEYLPESMPPTDIVIAINVHHDILTALPEFLNSHGIPGLIVPIDDGDWCPLGLEKQIEESLKEYGIQYAFPRPYCSLEPNGQPLIDNFIEYFKIGKPMIDVNIKNGKINECIVRRSSPCGCAYYVARELTRYKSPIDKELFEVISKAHHSYPCNASMNKDIILNEAPLHIAGYTHREVIYDGILKNAGTGKFKVIDEEIDELREKIRFRLS
ncbi:MAG: DUF166 domain-containing protein [Promethearchaeota archaeon]